MREKKIKDIDENKGFSKYVKRSFEIEQVVIDRLKQAKKDRGITMNNFVNKAITNELNAEDRYEKMEKAIDRVAEMLPKIIANAVDQSNLRTLLDEISNEIKPVVDAGKMNALDIKARQYGEFSDLKTNVLHRIANGHEIPNDLIYVKVVDSLLKEGYVFSPSHDVFHLTSHEIDPEIHYLI